MKFNDLVLLVEDNKDIEVEIKYYDDAQTKPCSELWYYLDLGDDSDIFHRLDGPAVQNWYEDGKKCTEGWFKDGEDHRLDGPAYQGWHENGQKGSEGWYKDGKRHRTDGPAFQDWFKNGKKASEQYFINGIPHRLDGPALQYWGTDGQKQYEAYYINGKEVPPNEVKQLYKQYDKEDLDILNDLNT